MSKEVKGKAEETKGQKVTKVAKRGKNTPWWQKYQAQWAQQYYYRRPDPPDNSWKAKTMEIYKARDQDEANRIVVCEDYHSFVANLHTTSTQYSKDTDDENTAGPDAGGNLKQIESDEDDKQWEEEKELSESSESDEGARERRFSEEIEMPKAKRFSLFGKKRASEQRLSIAHQEQQRLSLLPQTMIEIKKEKEPEKGSDYEADYENDDVENNTDMYSSDEDAKPFRIFGETSSSSENDSSGNESALSELTEKERDEYNKYIEEYFKKMMDDLEADNISTDESTDDENDPDNAIDVQSRVASEHQLEAFFTLIDQKLEEAKQQSEEQGLLESGTGSEAMMHIVYNASDSEIGGPGTLSKIHSDTIIPEPKSKLSDVDDDLPDDIDILFGENKCGGSEPTMNQAAKIFANMSEDRILADLGLNANERAIAKQIMNEQKERANAKKLKLNKKIRRIIIIKTCVMMFFLICFWALGIIWIIFLLDIEKAEQTIGVAVYKYYYTMSARIPLIVNFIIPILGFLRRINVGIAFFVTLVYVGLFYYVMVHLFILIPLAGDIARHYLTGGLEELMVKRMVQTKVNPADPLYSIDKNWGIGKPSTIVLQDVHEVWHTTQTKEKCCGINDPSDWTSDQYPYSCCKNKENPCLKNVSSDNVWQKGCFDTEWEKVKYHAYWYLFLCVASIIIACCTYIIFWNFREFLKVHKPYWIVETQDTYSHDAINMKDFPRKTSSLDLPDVTYFNMEAFNKDIYGIWPKDAVDIEYPYSSHPEYTEREVLVLPKDQLRG